MQFKYRNTPLSSRLLLVLLASILVSTLATAQTQPNIVLFIGDDIDHSYYGFRGHQYAITPNLDQLAAESVVFTHGYAASSVCKTSLQTLLGGVSPPVWRNTEQVYANIFTETPPNRLARHFTITLPRILRDVGYASFAGGKMWEGTFEDAGFDAGTMALPPQIFSIHGADTFGRESLQPFFDFVDQQNGPWFAWVAPKLPHTPLDPPQQYTDLYTNSGLDVDAVHYFANLTRMDARVGEIIDFLEQRGIRNDTVFIYLSDNGWIQRLLPGDPPQLYTLGGDNGKLSVHERGHRTPILLSWPGHFVAGTTTDSAADFADVYATILDLAEAPKNRCSDGKSLVRLAERGRGRTRRRSVLGVNGRVRYPFAEIVASRTDSDPSNDLPDSTTTLGLYMRHGRSRPWAYASIPERGVEELYDLRNDPDATNNLASTLPRRTRRLRRRAERAYNSIANDVCLSPQ